jgi:O-antigen/teichoic acid export membrane protein
MPKRQNSQNATGFSDDLRTMMRYGAPLYISVLLIGFIPLYQNVMLAMFTTDVEIGNYKAATNFASLMTVLSIPIATALLPAFSKLSSSTSQKTSMFFRLANKYTALIIVPTATLIITLSNEIVQIVYGSTYESASTFLAIYSLLYFAVGLGYLTITSLFNGLGQTRTTLKISLITLLTLIILSPILTKNYGVQGLIIAFLTASTAGTIYGSHVGRKELHIEYDPLSMLKIYLASAISAIAPLLILILAHLPNILTVAIGGFLYLLIYATLIPLTQAMTQVELQTATRITSRIRLLSPVAKPILKYQKRILQMRANWRKNRD